MHLIISNEIANRITFKDKQAFLLGGIAPDAVVTKDVSHFFEGDHNDYSRNIAYDTFFNKYSNLKQTSYILGYYTHLIADDIWLNGFSMGWLKNRLDNDPDIFKRYHHDFHLLNGKLLTHYSVTTDVLKGLETIDSVPDLAEATAKDVKNLLHYVKEDMNYSQEDLDEKLTVFRFEQIIGYIETSIEKSLFFLKGKI